MKTQPPASRKGLRTKRVARRNRNPAAPLARLSSPVSGTAYRVGLGSDVHRLAAGRRLVLGGVTIPFAKGPVGHSDGDALAHAICDALLGAARQGDIGRHFSNRSPRWRGASSLQFLRYVRARLDQAGRTIVNIDGTVSLERPRLAPYIPQIEARLAAALRIQPEQISVKAKSGEGLDAVGRGEAVRADAVALVCGD